MVTERSGVVILERAVVQDVDFRRATFDHLLPSGCVFVNCDFRGLRFDRRLQPLFSASVRSVFRDCRFDDTDLRKADPGQSRFERCTFDGAQIERMVSFCAEFVDCHFAGPIVASRFYGRPTGPAAQHLDPHRSVNEFQRNDFSAVDLIDTVFVMGISFGAQRWPDGDEYIRLDRLHQRMQRARTQIVEWSDTDARKAALEMLHATSVLYGDQNEIICRREDPRSPAPPDVQRKVWDALGAVL